MFRCTQALLSIYLLPDVTSHTKQIILLYSLCDLINLASSEASRTQVGADSLVIVIDLVTCADVTFLMCS